MRRLRAARASILSARLSLSAVSSSTELEAVFTSTPSFFRRSMTSWLERFRSLASWTTLTFTIRLPSPRRFPGRLAHRGCLCLGLRALRSDRLLGGARLDLRALRFRGGQGGLLGGLRGEPFGLHALRLLPGRLLRVAAVPVELGRGSR